MKATLLNSITHDRLPSHDIAAMFDAVSPRYDLLNHLLSCGVDLWWRRKAAGALHLPDKALILDAAAGTADLSLCLARRMETEMVTALDISAGMLERAGRKISRARLPEKITCIRGNCEALPFSDDSFDAVTTGFGIRNVKNPGKALCEFHRVLKQGGECVVLEFSRPRCRVIGPLFGLYFRYVLPLIGRIVSRHRTAYRYLHRSAQSFPCGEAFAAMMREAGFDSVRRVTLTFGIAAIYRGTKK